MFRCMLPVLVVLLMLPCWTVLSAETRERRSRVPVGIEPGAVNYYSAQWLFTDAFKQSMPWRSTLKGIELDLDQSGWVRSLREGQRAWSQVFADIEGAFPGGEYVCLYDGTGELRFSGSAVQVEGAPGRVVVNVDPAQGPIRIDLTKTDPSDYVRDIRLIYPGFEDKYREQTFHPRFLELLEGFSVIRFESLMHLGSDVHEQWQDRVTPDHQTQGGTKGMALEYAIALCNRAGMDAWFCMPHKVDTEYVQRFAEMVRSRLDTELKVYVEYGHDVGVWPTRSSQHCIHQGLAEGLSEDWGEARLLYYVRRSLETFAIWEEVFEKDPRLITVLGNLGDSLRVLDEQEAWKRADALGFVSIFGARYGQPDRAAETVTWSTEDFLQRLQQEVREPLSVKRLAIMREARRRGLDVVSFYTTPIIVADSRIRKDDPELFAALGRKTEEIHRQPEICDLYLQHLRRWYAAGGGLFVHVGLVHKPTQWGTYGLLERMSQDRDRSPKFQAIRIAVQGGPSREPSRAPGRPRADPLMGSVIPHLGARIDFDGYRPDGVSVPFDCEIKPPESVFWTPPFLNGQEKQKFYRVFIMTTPEPWTPAMIRLVPHADGDIRFIIRGASARRYSGAGYERGGTWPVVCDYDGFEVSGATLANGSVEDGPSLEELPGWRYGGWGDRPPAELIEDADDAPDGRRFVRVNDTRHLIGVLKDVKKSRPITLTFWTRLRNVERDFNVRVGVDGGIDNQGMEIDAVAIPDGAIFWKTDWYRGEWGDVPRFRRARTHGILLANVGEMWTPLSMTIQGEKSGYADLLFHAVRRVDGSGQFVRVPVEYRRIRVEGATLTALDGDEVPGDDESVTTDYSSGHRLRLTGMEKDRPVTIRFEARRPGKRQR